ncbi:MAG: nuclease [Synechococcaceae cyanobacterium]
MPLLGLGATLAVAPLPATAAEVLQVTGPDRLLIGDRNRTSSVRLGCLAVAPEDAESATALLRRLLPRHRRVNLRPLGVQQGELVANLRPIDPDGDDPAEALVAAGLATAVPCA